MKRRFKIKLSSDLDYEEMVVYITLDDHHLATINCEHGYENLEIETSPFAETEGVSIPLKEYMDILELGKKALLEAQKYPE